MKQLTPASDFVVRENIVMHFILAAVFFAIFLVSLSDKIDYEYIGKFRFKALYIFSIPAMFFLLKALKKRTAIFKINRDGFYYHDELVTSWKYFIDAVVEQDSKLLSIRDNFVLYIKYGNPEGKLFRSRFPLTNSQDKAEEEIIEAIRYFSSIHRARYV
jgi:hypothetical protein